ncbi:MAG: hypothetical protein ACI96W_003330, partial [Paraglaciecola sp.]
DQSQNYFHILFSHMGWLTGYWSHSLKTLVGPF